MANRKKEVYKVGTLTEGKRNLIAGLLSEYDIQTADDIQAALKDLLGSTIQEMMEAEMDEHLGYDKYERSSVSNYRNGTKTKHVRSKYGEFDIDVPQDRVHLNLKSFRSVRKISLLLMTRLSLCMQRE